MQGMFWVLVLTVLLLYICAILAVLLIEKGFPLLHLGLRHAACMFR